MEISYKIYKKIKKIDENFLKWLQDEIPNEYIKRVFSDDDYKRTSFVWDFIDNMDWNKETLYDLVRNKAANREDMILAYRRCYDIICSFVPEYRFSGSSALAKRISDVKNKHGDVDYKDVLFDIKACTSSDYIYSKYIEPSIIENRCITEEEAFNIANILYMDQLRINTSRNDYESNKIYIVSAGPTAEARFKMKGNLSKVYSAIDKFLDNDIENDIKRAVFTHPETGEKRELAYIVIIVS